MALLEIKDIHKSFGNLHVLKGIDLTVNKGDVIAILGPSGSGKTTLLRCINYLETADSGTMVFKNQSYDLANTSKKDIAQLRKHTGFVFQNYNLIPILNVYENIVLPVQLDGRRVDKDLLEQIVCALGLQDKLHNLPNNLSDLKFHQYHERKHLESAKRICCNGGNRSNQTASQATNCMGGLLVFCIDNDFGAYHWLRC